MKKYLSVMFLATIMVGSSLANSYAGDMEENVRTIATNSLNENALAYKVRVNGKMVELTQNIYVKNGYIMLPLREMAQQTGFRVEWNDEDNSAYLDNGEINTTVYIGVDSYYRASSVAIGMSAPMTLGIAPEIKNGISYVPVELFELLLDADRSVTEDRLINLEQRAYPLEKNSEDSSKDNLKDNLKDISEENTNDSIIGLPNPFKEHISLEEAEKVLSFEPKCLAYLPEGYALEGIETLDNDFIQLIYKKTNEKGENEICFRMAKGSDDISGDYREFTEAKTISVNNNDVLIRRNENGSGAIWTDGKMAFSIFSDEPLEDKVYVDIISGLADNKASNK